MGKVLCCCLICPLALGTSVDVLIWDRKGPQWAEGVGTELTWDLI